MAEIYILEKSEFNLIYQLYVNTQMKRTLQLVITYYYRKFIFYKILKSSFNFNKTVS